MIECKINIIHASTTKQPRKRSHSKPSLADDENPVDMDVY